MTLSPTDSDALILPPFFKHPNITEINHGMTQMEDNTVNMFVNRKSSTGGLGVFKIILPAMARDLYKVPSVKTLYEKRKEFDLVLIDHLFNEVSASP